MGISKKRQYLNIGIVILIAVFIFFPDTFRTKKTINDRGETDKHGFKQGIWEGYEDNQLIYRRSYLNDTLHGLSESFYDNGSIYTRALYKNGHFIDTLYYYHPNGQLNSFDIYDSKGVREGEFRIYNENGILSQSGIFSNGQFEGELLNYHENGKLESVKSYKEGIKIGTWLELNEQGDTISIETY